MRGAAALLKCCWEGVVWYSATLRNRLSKLSYRIELNRQVKLSRRIELNRRIVRAITNKQDVCINTYRHSMFMKVLYRILSDSNKYYNRVIEMNRVCARCYGASQVLLGGSSMVQRGSAESSE